jgi:hypothetical protein
MKKDNLVILTAIFLCFGGCNYSSRGYWQVRTELNKQEQSNIEALTKLYGYARYFYPNRQVAKMDWYKFLIYGIRAVEDCQTDAELVEKLKVLFTPIIPELRFDDCLSETHLPNKQPVFYLWEHRGTGVRPIENIYGSKIITCYDNNNEHLPKADSLYCFPINARISVYFPIAVSYEHHPSKELKALIGHTNKIKFKLLTKSPLLILMGKGEKEFHFLRDKNFRIADIIVRWNIIKHFYPYYTEDGLEKCWDECLVVALNSALKSADQREYYYTVCNLLSHVKDSHLTIYRNAYVGGWLASYLPIYYPDLQLSFSNDTCYYIDRNDNELYLVTSVNGIAVDSLIKEKSCVVSASTRQGTTEKLFNQNILFESFKKDSVLNISLSGTAHKKTVAVKTDKEFYYAPNVRSDSFITKIDGDLYYINPTSSMDNTCYSEFKAHIPEFRKAKGLIVDLRGYPGYYTDSIITHFSRSKIEWGDFGLPVYYYPDQMNVIYEKHPDFLEPSAEYISTQVVFLINSQSMSYCETIIDVLKKNNIGTFVGETTTGTNGDMTQIYLPVFGFIMTAIKDFSGYHGKGITPDIEVKQTDIKNNQDVILETAINYLKR